MKNMGLLRFGLLLGVGFVAVGCNNTPDAPRKTGSYTAARHMRVGSNIPQPESADGVNNTVNTDDLERAGNNANRASMGSMSGGGGR